MKKLVVASGNKGKIKEIKAILGDRYEVVSMKDEGCNLDVEETGTTFLENALIKARAIGEYLHEDVISDDSGLMVEALGGAPGVYSARYAGVHGDDALNRKTLLKNMQGITDRRAKFVSAVVLYRQDGSFVTGEGETLGVIIDKERGENGFGYDSLFLSDDLGVTFGEASDEEKNSVSHRSRALSDLIKKL